MYPHFKAESVSAVSPDCEIKKHTSSRKIGVLLSKKSDDKSTMTGSSVSSSSICLLAKKNKKNISKIKIKVKFSLFSDLVAMAE